ncbi:hypothetical protein MTR67_023922 [Solanum verrucosum]|uniref:Uncharacterized protein n=1 Tax=Solanum verrucosum TaxID=315347 RepID=A0AAF0QUG2_SOLVR|nr:hypothetical protein MTR67_023922 [Solanum verrucosum]
MKGVMRFGKDGKLSPRYIGPYRIFKKDWQCSLCVRATTTVSSGSFGIPHLHVEKVHGRSFIYHTY